MITTAASTSSSSAPSPQRSDAPGPRSHSGQRTRRTRRRQQTVTKSVRPLDHDDLVHRARRHPLEHAREEQPLLRGAEARGGARGEDDRGDAAHQLEDAVTESMTIGWSGCSVAGSPERADQLDDVEALGHLPTIA